jgi:hypothetical protein
MIMIANTRISNVEVQHCSHFGREIPVDFDCSSCLIKNECYQEWQRQYDQIIENCLSGLITYKEANEKSAELGCEVPA